MVFDRLRIIPESERAAMGSDQCLDGLERSEIIERPRPQGLTVANLAITPEAAQCGLQDSHCGLREQVIAQSRLRIASPPDELPDNGCSHQMRVGSRFPRLLPLARRIFTAWPHPHGCFQHRGCKAIGVVPERRAVVLPRSAKRHRREKVPWPRWRQCLTIARGKRLSQWKRAVLAPDQTD